MTNEVLKKKIMEVIAPFISAYGDDERIADALIEAGIGDVTEYKKTICELNMDVVAYRALSKADTLEQIIEGQKSLINEYEHRAEVAKRALREFAAQVGCRSCPYRGRCDISNPSAENDYQECYDEILRLAEE